MLTEVYLLYLGEHFVSPVEIMLYFYCQCFIFDMSSHAENLFLLFHNGFAM